MSEGYLERSAPGHVNWRGTASAEDDAVHGPDLYDIAKLDRERWTILAVDLDASGHAPVFETVRVHAFDRFRSFLPDHDDFMALADEQGSVPVTTFLLHDVRWADLIGGLRGLRVQLRRSDVYDADRELRVVELADIPPQD